MIERDLLAIPLSESGGRIDIYSGVARLSGCIWASHVRDTAAPSDACILIVHPTSNFLGHYALHTLAEMGVAAVGLTTRYVGNDSALLVENCVLDVGAAIAHLRQIGYERVVLVGNSGGGSLAALYQSQAEKPTLTSTPSGDPPDLTVADLPPADRLVLAMAHLGRAAILTEWLDPAIVDEHDPWRRATELDMFSPDNGPPYSPDFVRRYREAQVARNRRITRWVRDQLDRLRAEADKHDDAVDLPDDMPFVVHGTAADPRFLDLALEPSDRAATTLWGPPARANYAPATLAHHTSLRSWLSQWSYDDCQANAVTHLPNVSVPVQVVYGTADTAVFPSHVAAMYGAITHTDKQLVAIEGADHYFRGQPELARRMCEHIVEWARG